MSFRTKLQISLTVLSAVAATIHAAHLHSGEWLQFGVFTAAVLLSSGFKVALPRGDGTMSLNFPFLLFALVDLSPLQLLILSALSIAAQCRIRVKKIFSAIQILFNIANTMIAAELARSTERFLVAHHTPLAPALALAAVSYFFWSTGSVALIISSSSGDSVWRLWRSEFPWYLPFYIVGAVIAAAAHWICAEYGWATSLLLIPMVYTIYRSYNAQTARMKERQQHAEETEALHLRTIEGLAMAIEAKDQNTHDHLFRVRNYVEQVGKAMGLTGSEMQALHTASFLHDIGKLAVPEHIVNKPGKLTPEEFDKMKIHPVVGAEILERVRFPYPVVPIVRSHHEWWNGKGYPDGLVGEQIPIGARVLSVVDCFDALVSDRPYRKAMPVPQALALLREMSGTQFDPVIVDVMEELATQLEPAIQEETGTADEFSPLVTEFHVSRGNAPGAGFQQEGQVSPSGVSLSEPMTSLDLIAAASHEAQTLFEMSQSLGNSLRLSETMSVVSSRMKRLIPFDTCALYLKEGKSLVVHHLDGECVKSFSADPIPTGQGISGWVAESGKPILNGNAGVEPNYRSKFRLSGELRSALSIPLFDLQRKVFGVVTLYASMEDAFLRDHLRILQAMESKLSLSLQNALHFRTAANAAETDFLTQLPNARGLFKLLDTELRRCEQQQEHLALAVCDLNGFKDVNDRLGHLKGNMLLTLVAEELRAACDQGAFVARMGGDEFVFIMPGIDQRTAQDKLSEIDCAVAAACDRAGRMDMQVSVSIGLSFFPTDAVSAEELLAIADRRMYLDKRTHYEIGGNTRHFRAVEALAV